MNKKKNSQKNNSSSQKKRSSSKKKDVSNHIENTPVFQLRREVKGFLLLAFSLILFLSLLTFSHSHGQQRNLLGAVGHSLGWLGHSLFGIVSYLACIFIAWAGWRCFFDKTINEIKSKLMAFFILMASSCLLLAFVEESFPAFSMPLKEFFYYDFFSHDLTPRLGGFPFYFVYRDLPFVNMQYAFNSFGAALIFTTTLLASVFYLCKIQPKNWFEGVFNRSEALLLTPAHAQAAAHATAPASISGGDLEKINPLRFVKVRIPFANWGKDDDSKAVLSSSTAQQDSASAPDLLAIKPEMNLKERPSISAKEQTTPLESRSLKNPLHPPGFVLPLPPSPQIPTPVDSVAPPKTIKEAVKNAATSASSSLSKREKALTEQKVFNGDFSAYKLPPPNMLSSSKKVEQSQLKQNLRHQAEVLEETLHSFGIEAKVGQINCGPTITSFEVHPSIGVKVQKIKALESDIALNLEAKSIRIIAPIPGKAAVGIEVPNAFPQEVSFKEMLQAYQQSQRKFHIPILLGKAVNGDYVMSDLAKMPHCIIAGATGSGKSVCINTIVMSILLNSRPDQIKLLMVDPKKVELTPYSRLPHMLAPVICEPKGACSALQWLVKEMEKRYDILKLIGVRNIESFNNRVVNAEAEAEMKLEIPRSLPYIVAIIDELADLMMVASSDIETYIARIAQMARAVGIHLILATQRPSREVITGIIKANFPTRIAFKVASRINSQIILDETGAETLLGNGDMLFLPPGSSTLIRAQGAFVRDEDINKVIESICKQSPPNYVIESFDEYDEENSNDDDDDGGNDPLYKQAKQLLMDNGNMSTTFLQRKLKIGYARAASLMDELQDAGLLLPATSPAKPRKLAIEVASTESK